MMQLVNLSNYKTDVELIDSNADCLRTFLQRHHLNGIEMMVCEPWDNAVHRKELIQGVHLCFWSNWLDFWRGDQEELLRQFGRQEDIKDYYGGLSREEWLNVYRENIRAAVRTEAKYLVFHVGNVRTAELFHWRFAATSSEVIAATVEVINELVDEIPVETMLLLENLWWPGLTLKDNELTATLLENIQHANVGIMLDTGHLMNTNPQLTTEIEGIDYIMETLCQLGEYSQYIRGLHLHRSLAGEYITRSRATAVKASYTPEEAITHVLKMDEHLPFNTPEVQRIVKYLKPDFLVHEFFPASLEDWGQKVRQQQQALGIRETAP